MLGRPGHQWRCSAGPYCPNCTEEGMGLGGHAPSPSRAERLGTVTEAEIGRTPWLWGKY